MRVFVLTSSFPRGPRDIAGKFVLEWCEVLRAAGHDVRVYTWGWGSSWSPPGIEVRRVRYLPRGWDHIFDEGGAPDTLERAPWRVIEAPAAAASMLVAALGRDLPDLWVGHWFLPGGALARLCGDLTRRPSVVVGHSAGIHMLGRLPRPLRHVVRRLVVRAGATTIPTEALRRLVGDEAEVLPMGFEPVGPAPERSGPGLLCFGRLVPVKGFSIIPAALSRLTARPPLHFAGDGPGREALEAQCRELHIDATFHGWVDAEAKRALFPLCGFAMFPSRVLDSGRHEGRPVSVLEVASMGVIPLLSCWPGACELVVDPELQLVESTTAAAWADAIARLMSRPPAELARLRDATIEQARAEAWDQLGPRWLEFLEKQKRRPH